jgi:hypothetical protein
VITCLLELTGEVSAGAELPPRNNPNGDKTSWQRHRASHATELNGNITFIVIAHHLPDSEPLIP